MRILVVDDSATSRALLSRAVDALGHECILAADGRAGWETFLESRPDVVISDWVMPELDGVELCRRIREDPDAPYTYVIIVTSREGREHALAGMRAGADDYIVKPPDTHELGMRLIAAERVTALHRRVREQQRELENEVRVAAAIQRGLLPVRPPDVPGAALGGLCVPATSVGGDYYDFLVGPSGALTLVIADVAGHSIGSALVMAMARSLLRGQIASGRDPGEVLARTNGAMFDDLANAGLFITMFCAGFDPRTRELQFANAGHNPPLLRRASGTVEALDADGAAIGLLPDLEFEQRATTLTAGDLLVLYTDGVVEAGIAAGDGFGERRLRQLVRDCGGDAPPAELAQLVYGAVARHAGPAARDDDVTLAVLRAQ